MVQIHPQHLTLDQVLSKRLFRIPEYQRAYSWQSKQRRDLFNDVKSSFGAGKAKDHFMATVVGLRIGERLIITDEHQVIEVVDGQQRITTLILLLKAIEKALKGSDPTQAKVKADLRETLVKPDQASLLLLQTNHDTSHYFSNYITGGTYPDFSEASTLADRQLLTAMKECEGFVDEWVADGKPLLALVGHLKNRLTFIFHEIGDESLVYSVFEVLNSRGLEVSWFDRLKSMLMGKVFESDSCNKEELIDQVHSLWADIYRAVGISPVISTESLRFAATLRSKDRPSQTLTPERSVNTLLSLSQNASQVMQTSSWLLDVTKSVDKLRADRRRSAVTQIAHARLVAVAVGLRDNLNYVERESILSQWEKVTFRIYGIYGKDARSAVGDYVRLAWDIHNKEISAKQIISALSEIGEDYPSTEEDLRREIGRKSAYGDSATLSPEALRYFFQRYEEHLAKQARQNFSNEEWNRIWLASTADSIEHISPQSAGKSYVHWLGNLTILPPKLNSKLQDNPPKTKAPEYTKTGLLVAQEVATRIGCSGGKWRKSDIIARENDLFKWAAREWAD